MLFCFVCCVSCFVDCSLMSDFFCCRIVLGRYTLVNKHSNGRWTIWRCISYTSGFSIAIWVSRSVLQRKQLPKNPTTKINFGGSAALLFAHLVDRVHAFSPQVDLVLWIIGVEIGRFLFRWWFSTQFRRGLYTNNKGISYKRVGRNHHQFLRSLGHGWWFQIFFPPLLGEITIQFDEHIFFRWVETTN